MLDNSEAIMWPWKKDGVAFVPMVLPALHDLGPHQDCLSGMTITRWLYLVDSSNRFRARPHQRFLELRPKAATVTLMTRRHAMQPELPGGDATR